VMKARDRQALRHTTEPAHHVATTNSHLTPALLAEHCTLDRAGARLLETAVTRLALSARGYHRVLKVARTIADLAESDSIEAEHLAEALQFRMRE
jgi:magnesium chelatase family protein